MDQASRLRGVRRTSYATAIIAALLGYLLVRWLTRADMELEIELETDIWLEDGDDLMARQMTVGEAGKEGVYTAPKTTPIVLRESPG